MTFADFLRQFREKQGLSYRDFVTDINEYLAPPDRLTHAAVHLWEHGRTQPSVSLLYYIRQHAPAGSWERTFGESGMQVLSQEQLKQRG